ncbi:ACP S-malonyltransferase [Lactobacillus xujianguonis]|uniref:ACP S-malonyltransferase n=1 Tax=Lactobacillus xujianguonis TaxID=2495899 RepID=UPI000FD6D404|nr:ACP S-malonyltransferase [Lactobacillus xujianguonis]RVU76869.1 ACP S-malonyltransferase [Lactobacillus xujianguonis]
MKLGILFSGQGAQKAGMGLDFLADPLFKETIETASEASQQDIVALFKDEHDELNKTIHVQPALIAFEAGVFCMLKRDLPALPIAGMVGLSLGECGAMFASDALPLADTISLVSDRARYMQADADKVDNGMAALVKPDLDKVNEIIATLKKQNKQVYLSNYNSPSQVVIGGVKQDVDDAAEAISEAQAAKRVVNLRVNGAFHTPLFNGARQKMHDRLQEVNFKQTTYPVISNTTVKPFTTDWAEIMEKQLAVPTHFGDDLAYLVENQGIDSTLEIGPGKTLSSFARQVDRKLKRYNIENFDQYQEFVEAENEAEK